MKPTLLQTRFGLLIMCLVCLLFLDIKVPKRYLLDMQNDELHFEPGKIITVLQEMFKHSAS